ncbi:hypothetical protein, partial [Plasmodium yoelii yoelii]
DTWCRILGPHSDYVDHGIKLILIDTS